MADATTLETMQLTSASNQPNSDSEDASSAGTYGIRPMFQQIQASLRTESLNSEWTDINGLTGGGWTGSLSPTHTSGTSFTYQGDQTGYFTVNRRLKAILNASTIYGSVFSSTYNAGPMTTSVVALWDSGSLDGTETNIMIGSLNPAHSSIPGTVPSQTSTPLYAVVTNGGSGNAYTGSLSPAITAYVVGQIYALKFTQAVSGSPVTVALNGLAAKTIKKNVSTDLIANDILASQIVEVIYDGTNFQLQGSITTMGKTVLSTAGAGSFIVPSTSLIVDIYGAGGGGAGGGGNGAGNAGGDGGSGAYGRMVLSGLTVGATIAYTVGAAGTGGAGGASGGGNGADGVAGGASIFNSISINGGAAGVHGASNGTAGAMQKALAGGIVEQKSAQGFGVGAVGYMGAAGGTGGAQGGAGIAGTAGVAGAGGSIIVQW